MTKLRAIIVDDEPLALRLMKSKLALIDQVEVIAECRNGREAINAVMDLQPDILFLDIQMPGLDGFETIKKIQSEVMPLVVFTTAYEQYALDAFEVHAVDYVLKPIDLERIKLAVERAVQRLKSKEAQQENDSKTRMLGAIDSIRQQTPVLKTAIPANTANVEALAGKIMIKDRGEITLIKQKDIEWIDAAGDYCCVHTHDETHIKRSTLKHLLDELDPSIFKRVHRSTIVNLNFVNKVIPHTKGEFFLQIGQHEKVKVSRNYKDAIKNFLA